VHKEEQLLEQRELGEVLGPHLEAIVLEPGPLLVALLLALQE
jgi:hypothetical protein